MQKMLTIQRSLIGGQPKIVIPGRRLIKDGPLMKVIFMLLFISLHYNTHSSFVGISRFQEKGTHPIKEYFSCSVTWLCIANRKEQIIIVPRH